MKKEPNRFKSGIKHKSKRHTSKHTGNRKIKQIALSLYIHSIIIKITQLTAESLSRPSKHRFIPILTR